MKMDEERMRIIEEQRKEIEHHKQKRKEMKILLQKQAHLKSQTEQQLTHFKHVNMNISEHVMNTKDYEYSDDENDNANGNQQQTNFHLCILPNNKPNVDNGTQFTRNNTYVTMYEGNNTNNSSCKNGLKHQLHQFDEGERYHLNNCYNKQLQTTDRNRLGTIAAVLTGYAIYMAIPVFLSGYVSDSAVLKTDTMIFAKCAKWAFPILLGVWAATLSSAVGSFLCAPRVFQALARDRIMPRIFARGWGATDDPRFGSFCCFAIAAACLWFGDTETLRWDDHFHRVCQRTV